MKVACPSCRSLFEIEPNLTDGPGAPLCEACSAADAAPLPPLRRARPKLPEITFSPRRAKDATEPETEPAAESPRSSPPAPISPDELDMMSDPNAAPESPGAVPEGVLDGGFARSGRPTSSMLPPDPGPMSSRGGELSLSDLASDVESVNLRDLGVVLGPAALPPAWGGAPSAGLREGASSLKPRRALLEEKSAAPEKPSFFRVDSIPPPGDDVQVDLLSEVPPPPSSGRRDLMALVAPPSAPPRGRPSDILGLSGGLFNFVPPQPQLAPPQEDQPLASSIAPVLRLDRVRSSRPPPPVAEDAPLTVRRSPRSGVLGPVVSEGLPTWRRSGLVGWGAGAVAAAAVIGFAAAHLGAATGAREEAREATVSTAPPSAVPPARGTADTPIAEAPKPPPPAVTARSSEVARPASTVRHTDPPAQVRPTSAPSPPPVVAPVPPPSPAPPPPSGGAEFDRAAAKAALSAAASTASSCKQADDPGGGARVSVTFAPSGRVTASKLAGGPFVGTPTGSCIARAFRSISVPAFAGDPVTLSKEVSVH